VVVQTVLWGVLISASHGYKPRTIKLCFIMIKVHVKNSTLTRSCKSIIAFIRVIGNFLKTDTFSTDISFEIIFCQEFHPIV